MNKFRNASRASKGAVGALAGTGVGYGLSRVFNGSRRDKFKSLKEDAKREALRLYEKKQKLIDLKERNGLSRADQEQLAVIRKKLSHLKNNPTYKSKEVAEIESLKRRIRNNEAAASLAAGVARHQTKTGDFGKDIRNSATIGAAKNVGVNMMNQKHHDRIAQLHAKGMKRSRKHHAKNLKEHDKINSKLKIKDKDRAEYEALQDRLRQGNLSANQAAAVKRKMNRIRNLTMLGGAVAGGILASQIKRK